MTADSPAAGKFVKQVPPEYTGTNVYHALYLPDNWAAGNQYPVIVEYPCNKYQAFSGKVEDAILGYYLTGGIDYIWVVMPVIQNNANLDYGFGDQAETAGYLKTNLRRILDTYGGDSSRVFITGFSRGAIGCNYYGTYDDSAADIWLGFLPNAHMDMGAITGDPDSAKTRLKRTNKRSTFVVYGSHDPEAAANAQTGEKWLRGFGYPVIDNPIPHLGHTDTWVMENNIARQNVRQWLSDTCKSHPGVHHIGGRVTDSSGTGLPGVLIETGATHFVTTDRSGHYSMNNLTDGLHTVSAQRKGCVFQNHAVALLGKNIENIDFVEKG